MKSFLEHALQTAQGCGAPFYLYNRDVVLAQIANLKNALPGFEFLYSIKTNPYMPLVKTIVQSGVGSDSASLVEVYKAEEAGVAKENIFYSAPGKTVEDIKSALEKCTIIADSYTELQVIDSAAAKRGIVAEVGLRINPDRSMFGGKGTASKFGVDEETLAEKAPFIAGLRHLKVTGIHVHLRSQVLDHETIYTYYKNIFELADYCRGTLGFAISFINFGGGLGVPYSTASDKPLNVSALGEKCEQLIAGYQKNHGVRLLIESGRYIVCECGHYITPVVDIKTSRGKQYVIVRNGLNGFLRPSVAALLGAATGGELAGFSAEPLFTAPDAFDVFVLGKQGEEGSETVDIVGNLCTATDVLAQDVKLPPVEVGDFIAVTKAGSYSYSLSPLMFSGHPLPEQILMTANGKIVE